MSTENEKQKKSKISGRQFLRLLFIALFSVGLLIGAGNSISILRQRNAARDIYTDLSILTQGAFTIPEEKDNSATPGSSEPSQPMNETPPAEPERVRRVSMDFAALQEINPDVCAWIRSEGMGLDYPIVHTDNNDYYLEHLVNKAWNPSGTLFIDYRNTGLFDDGNTVIYGHNMRDGSMFHALNEYKAQDFYDTWPTLTIFTPDGDYLVELICGTIEDGNYNFVKFNFEDYADFSAYAESLLERSTFQSDAVLKPGDQLVSLCTCTYEKYNARYMLVGRLIALYEDSAVSE